MLDWLKNNLYSRWSFNLLVWHGFRMILRFILFAVFGELICSKVDQVYTLLAITLVCFFPMHVIIFAPPAIMLYLEKKRGIRINRKFLDNNKIFIPYLILSFPAIIIECTWIIIAAVGILAPLPDILANITTVSPFEFYFLLISPDFYKTLLFCYL